MKIRKVLAILLALALCASSLFTVSAAASATAAVDIQAVIDGIDVDNNTTQETVEAAVTAVYSDAAFDWTTAFFKKEAMPKVDVMLKNESGTYDVYYTQAGTPGRVTGTATVTVAGTAYTVILNKVITPAEKSIQCDSMDTFNCADSTTTYTGSAELLVIKNANKYKIADSFAKENTTLKAVIIDSAKGFGQYSFCKCTALQGVFIDKLYTSANFYLYTFNGASLLKYFYINSIEADGGNDIIFDYGIFEGCNALEYLSFDMGGTGTIKFNSDRAFAYCTSLRQLYLNTGSVTLSSSYSNMFTNAGQNCGGTRVIVSNDTIATAITGLGFSNVTAVNENTIKFNATSQEYLEECVAVVAVNNGTTQADFENAVTKTLNAEITWTAPFVKVISTPVVEVKLLNANGVYDVYYTSKGHSGTITGVMSVTVGDETFTLTLNDIITPEQREIKCDSIDVVTGSDANNWGTYSGTAELLVIESETDKVDIPDNFTFNSDNSTSNVKDTLKAVVVKTRQSHIGKNAFRGATSLQCFFATSYTTTIRFNEGCFRGAGIKYMDLGTPVAGASDQYFTIFGMAFYYSQFEGAYFDLGDTKIQFNGWSPLGNKAADPATNLIFNCGGVIGTSNITNDTFTNKATVTLLNKTAYDQIATTAIGSDNQVTLIDASEVNAPKTSVNDYVENVKAAFKYENSYTNSTTVSDVIATAKSAVSSDITVTVNMGDMIYDAAVDGAIIADDIYVEDVFDPVAYQPIVTTNTHNGSIKAVVTLSRDDESVSFNVEAPIYANIDFDTEFGFDRDTSTDLHNLSTFCYDEATDTITGIEEEKTLIYIDGNDEAYGSDGVKIADGAFSENSDAIAVIIKNAELGKNVFNGSTSIRVAYLGEGVTFVENGNDEANATQTFRGASALEYVSYDDSIESVGRMEFLGTKALKGFVMPKNVKFIGTYLFGNSVIKSCYISDEVQIDISDSNNIFRGCNYLVSLRIPEGTKTLHNNSIAYTSSLKTLIFPTTLENISGAATTDIKTNSNNLVLVNYADLDTVTFAKLITSLQNTSQGITFRKIITVSGSGAYDYATASGIDCDVIGDANFDGVFNILDLVRLKKNIAQDLELEEIIFDINNDGLSGNAADLAAQIKLLLNNNTDYAAIQALDLEAAAKKQAVLESETTIDLTGKTVYYVDDTAAENGNGSEDSPWKTLAQVNDAELSENSVVLFKRGGLWRGNLVAQSGVTYSAYGEGDKPAIYANTYDGTWFDDDNDGVWVYSKTTTDIGGIHLGGDDYAVKVTPYINNGALYLSYTAATDTADAVYADEFTPASLEDNQFYSANNSVDDSGTLYFKSSVDPNTLDLELIVNEKVVTATGYDITIDNLTLKYGVFGVYATEYWVDYTIGGEHLPANNITVSNCEIGWIGGNVSSYNEYGVPTRYGNGIEFYANANNITIKNNYIYQCYDAAMTHQCGSYYENISYLNNIVENCTYGVEYILRGEDGADLLQKDILIEGNFIRNIGFGHCSTRTDKYSAAIRCTANKNFPSENFVINNNVFDRSNEYMLLIGTEDKADLPVMTNNTYVQHVNGLYLFNALGRVSAYGESTATEITGVFNMANEDHINAFVEIAGCEKLYLIFK